MEQQQILQIAMEQSAIDSGCRREDFFGKENRVVVSQPHPQARKYLELPFFCDLTSYGNQVVASAHPDFLEEAKAYLERFSHVDCFETPALHILEEKLRPFGCRVCFMAEYFLPELKSLQPLSCPYPLKLLGPEEFQEYYLPQWSNALCKKRRHLDVLAVGAFDGDKLVGLAGCSADCETMWQIGVDVLPEYRKQGIGAAVTSHLAMEILRREKVPFYCCAWSNIRSGRNAVKSGFRPAWVQVTAKSESFVDQMLKEE